MQAIPLPPPYQGQVDQIPEVALQSPASPLIDNFNLDDGNLKLRKGDGIWSAKANESVLCVVRYGDNEKLFAVYDAAAGGTGICVADVSTAGTFTDVTTTAGAGGDDEIVTLEFNKNLMIFGEQTLKPSGVGVLRYDGSTWGTSGYTYATMVNPFGGAVHKDRAYIYERNSLKYAYSGISAISGAMTEVDLSQIVSRKGYIYGIKSISLSEGIQQENVIAFIISTGEVLVYGGSYPNSADWTLVGRFFISEPLYHNSFVDMRGDSFVITRSELISLRALFTQGDSVAKVQSISSPIRNRWAEIMKVMTFGAGSGSRIYIKGTYDSARERLIISFPYHVARGGFGVNYFRALRLVYSFRTQSWVEHVIEKDSDRVATAIAQWKDGVVYGTLGAVMEVEQLYQFKDKNPDNSSNAIFYELRSAPVAIRNQYIQKAEGLDFIIKTDLYDLTEYSLISDLGVLESEVQLIPDMGGTLVKAHANIGIEGNYIQYRIRGYTDDSTSVGYELYATNVWMDFGNSPR